MIESHSLKTNIRDGVLYFTFPAFEKYDFITHAFSSRLGGVSQGIYESMNLGFNTGDSYDNVLQNYGALCKALSINRDDLVLSDQQHDIKIMRVEEVDKGKGITKSKDYSCIDGLVTNKPGIPLVTFYADCVPLFFLDPVKKVVGMAHSGWKGTVNKIGKEMICKFVSDYRCNIGDILVGIGPSIGPCCYEVDEAVCQQFGKLDYVNSTASIKPQGNGKYIIDLWEVNKTLLISEGIKHQNITVTDLCTKCNKDIFFSHRGHSGKRGSLVGIIQLLD